MRAILIFGLTLGMAVMPRPTPHKFEDGFVERTLEVVIRDDLATAKYSIGLNESTLIDLLQQWKKPQPDFDQPESPHAGAVDGLGENQNPIELASEKVENPIGQELLADLQIYGPKQIAEALVVTCDGRPLKIKNILADPAPRHPFVLTVKFEFEIPVAKSAKIRIEDQNFREQTGAVRYALKTLGDTVLVESNVAPIIIRAQRIELAELSEKETVDKTSISAHVLRLTNPKEDD